MKKEAFLAIFIGIIVGLGITYGIYQVRQRFAPPVAQIETVTSAEVLPSPSGAEKLFITSPQNESVVYESDITLSGTTQSQEMVVIFVNEQEYITQADDIGAFAVKIQLTAGSNIIQVTSLSSDGTEHVKDLVVILDPETGVETASASAKTNTTPSPSAKASASPKATVKPTVTPKPIATP